MRRTFHLILATTLIPVVLTRASVLDTASGLSAALKTSNGILPGFDITADITYVSTNRADEKTNVALEDATGSVLIRAEDRRHMATMPQRGIRARCLGVIIADRYGRRFGSLTNFVALSKGNVRPPTRLTRTQLFNGRHDYQFCRFFGVLRDATVNETDPHWILLSICSHEGCVFATVPISTENDLERLEQQIGRAISVNGLCVPYDHSPRIQTGRIFKIACMGDIRFHATSDNAKSPIPTVDSLRLSQPSDTASLGQHRAIGWIVAIWQRRHALLKTDNGDFVKLDFSNDTPIPRYGERIEARGLPDSDLFSITLFNASWQAVAGPALTEDAPLVVSARALTRDRSGRPRVNCAHNGHPITIIGIVRNLSARGDGDNRIYIESDGCLVPVDISVWPSLLQTLDLGSRVSATGTCILDIAAPQLNAAIPRLLGFSLVLRTPDDLQVLARPAVWISRRFLGIVTALLVVILVTLGWCLSLKRLAEKRGRQLSEEALAHVTSEFKVYERTRLAVELHDSIAQNLTGISLEIDAAHRLASDQPAKMCEHLAVAAASLKSCRNELRNCIWDLRNQTLETDDLESAIRQTLTPHLDAARLAIRFPVPRERLSDNTLHAMLCIIRELTVNAVRHGKATSISVAGALEEDFLMFSVRDNGTGFDPAHHPNEDEGHYGLLGIRERINSFEGTFNINSAPGQGTHATIRLLIPKQQ